jgi:myo-inositol-1(or 4)-monophosphatase
MNKEIEVLLTAIQIAGAKILAVQDKGIAIHRKKNNDLVTEADLTANSILKTHLIDAFPQDAWLSEESVDDLARLSCKRVWVVDPIDGTLEFAAGIPEYAISVALVENGEPILSAVFNPATGELFHAIKNGGAWLNHQKIQCRESADNRFTLLASRSEYQRGEWQKFNAHQINVVGSIAYKLALVAAGKADATFSLGPKNEWDIAAGCLLIQEAGGKVSDKNQHKISFNNPSTLVNSIVGASNFTNKEIFKLIKTCA